jgi:hypothetical protein
MRKTLPVSSYRALSSAASSSRLLNCYAEQLPPDTDPPVALIRTPGITDFVLPTVGNGPIYAMLRASDLNGTVLFVVSGTELWTVTETGTGALMGDIGAVTSIDMEWNGTHVVVVNTPNAFYCDGTSAGFAQITDADFTSRGASDVEFLDNYLLFVEPDTGRFFGADLGSASNFEALSFATAESSPDNLVGMKVDHGQLFLAGTDSMEIWENTGAPGFPFERAIGGRLEIGCLNGRTLAKQDNSVFWLANDYTVRRLDGATPTRVSQHGVETSFKNMTISTAKAYTYSQEGHLFYVLSFFEGTFVYDCTTQEWHERQSYGYDYWRAQAHAQIYGLEIVGDIASNKLGYLTRDVYTEWGDTQVMEWTYQPIHADGARAFHERLEIILETGVGLTSGQGSAPEIMLQYSNDGGKTFPGSMPNRSLGAIGRYEDRVVWQSLGSSRVGRVYRASVSDPVKVIVRDTQAQVKGGRWA